MLGRCGSVGKTWTVLVYANGNNEMEPEIYRGIQTIENAPAGENVKVVIQLARAPQRLVQVFGRQAGYPANEQWDGVRRYVAGKAGLSEVADLGRVNMADPATLADFLTWGVANYPADNIMAILSGHGAGFVGILTDYTQPHPVLMSMKGVTEALRHCRRSTGKQCAILVLDACFMNMVEIWYEFALTPTRPVKYLLAPRGDASMECLPYDVIIGSLGAGAERRRSAPQALADIVAAVNGAADKDSGDVMAVNLAADNFVQLKAAIDQLAGFITASNLNLDAILGEDYRKSPHYPLANLQLLAARLSAACPDDGIPNDALQAILDRIAPVPRHAAKPKLASVDANIFLPVTPGIYPCFASAYEQLLFAAGNRWLQVLRGGGPAECEAVFLPKQRRPVLPPPVPMALESVAYSLHEQCPHLSDEEVRRILQELGWQPKPKT